MVKQLTVAMVIQDGCWCSLPVELFQETCPVLMQREMRRWFRPVCLQVSLVVKGHLPRCASLQWPGLHLRLGQLQHGDLHGPWRLPPRCVHVSLDGASAAGLMLLPLSGLE